LTAGCSEIEREYILVPHEDSVGTAREHVRDTLAGCADADTLGQVELVVSELVTNSVRYGPGEPITLRLIASAQGEIAGTVEDRGTGVVAIREPDADGIGGVGLLLVDALTSEWGVHTGTTHVWFRFEAAA
jgi:anti-sigma regulatory factor (Ser/Thr protein kinase)